MSKVRDRNQRQAHPAAQRVMDAASGPVTTGAGTKDGRTDPTTDSSRVTAATSRPGYTAAGERTAEYMKAKHQSWADSQPATSSCAFCDWKIEGTALECREEAKAHREREHPEACIRKPRRRGSNMRKRTLRSASEEEQIKVDTEEARRLRTERELGEMLAKVERGRARVALDSSLESV